VKAVVLNQNEPLRKENKQLHSTDNEVLEIIDSDDNVIGTATRAEIHESGLMHRAVHIFVFNPAGEIYVQMRSESKDRHPGKLDSSAAGHVDPGESYHDAAVRELHEEISVSSDLKEAFRVKPSEITDQESVVLFTTSTDQEPIPNPDEAQWGKFIRPEELTRMMNENANDFVPAFIFLWKEFLRIST
jgi:isopentenyldiphosphate isomerase